MEQLIIVVLLLIMGFIFGRIAESRHYQSIREREQAMQNLLLIPSRFPPPRLPVPESALVAGTVVISVDYFKVFLANLRGFFGGRISSYETLVDRARREAILRMKAEAQALGADMICNVKLETSSISKNSQGGVGSVEALAYGTALIFKGQD